MRQDEALQILGLQVGASASDISDASNQKKTDLQNKITSAPTEALKAKFQQLLDKVIAAEQSLSQSSSGQPKASSRSPLSETKLADIPGMAANTGGFAGDANGQMFQSGHMLSNRYEIKEFIDAGGMGEVYRAFDKTRDKDIALKVMRPAMLASAQAQERFLNEAKLSSELSHPNIVNVFDVAQEGQYYYLTMELLQGQDLRGFITNHQTLRQPIEIEEAIDIIQKIAGALQYAHKQTVHRDIKPENIWLDENGEVKLMDFGIARMLSTSQMTQTGASLGTAYYMAPEQIKGRGNIDGRADQFSLAIVLYEMLAGEIPAGRIEPVHSLRKEIPKALSMNIDKALSAKPEDRFVDMAAFSEALNAKGGGVSMPALPVKNIGMVASVMGAIVLLVVLGSSGALSDLSNLLPQSAEEIAAQKAESAKLIGEIKTYKQRLENGRRQLSSDLRDAERNNSKDEKALAHWQSLTDNYIFNGSQITDLEGELSMGDSLLRDDGYEQAKLTLSKVRDGYKNLWEQFTAAERLYAVNQQNEAARQTWLKRQRAYNLAENSQSTAAKAAEAQAQTQEREGDFVGTQIKLTEASQHWRAAVQAVEGQVAAIEADRATQAKQAKQAAEQAAAQAKQAAEKAAAVALAKRIKQLVNSLELVAIPAGSFSMGSPNGLGGEEPIHRVSIKGFKLMAKEVTFAQYDAYANASGKELPSDKGWGRGTRPVINVNWQEAKDFARWLSQQTGQRFRLPSEAEWEYACRSGGKDETYCGGSTASSVGWYSGNSGNTTHPVGQKQANGLGLYDMSGNVEEWVEDCWNASYNGAPSNGSVWLGGDCSRRVLRGGPWYNLVYYLRSASRFGRTATVRLDSIGFRLAQD